MLIRQWCCRLLFLVAMDLDEPLKFLCALAALFYPKTLFLLDHSTHISSHSFVQRTQRHAASWPILVSALATVVSAVVTQLFYVRGSRNLAPSMGNHGGGARQAIRKLGSMDCCGMAKGQGIVEMSEGKKLCVYSHSTGGETFYVGTTLIGMRAIPA